MPTGGLVGRLTKEVKRAKTAAATTARSLYRLQEQLERLKSQLHQDMAALQAIIERKLGASIPRSLRGKSTRGLTTSSRDAGPSLKKWYSCIRQTNYVPLANLPLAVRCGPPRCE